MRSFLAITLLMALSAMGFTAEEAPKSAFEQQLESLAKAGPVVAILETPESENPKSEIRNPKSLEELASSFGLKLFEQDGIQVIGPAEKADLTDLISGRIPSWLSDPLDLISSLNEAQLNALGSPQGLPAASLAPEQYAFLSTALSDSFPLTWLEPDKDPVTREASESGLPIRDARLIAWLDISDIVVHFPGEEGQDIAGSPQTAGWQMKPTKETEEGRPGFRMVPNVLKESDLDYSQPALQAPISVSGRTNLAELVDTVVRESGLDLHASPGSDKVYLCILASNVPAGSLLKAVSLATTGTWRRFGDAYIFTVDLVGIGQIDALACGISTRMIEKWLTSEVQILVSSYSRLTVLPFAAGTPFVPTPYQMQTMASMDDEAQLPWSSLTPYQQALIESELSKSKPERLSDLARDAWTVDFGVTMNLAAEFPDLGRIKLPLTQLGVLWYDPQGGVAFGPVPGLTVIPHYLMIPQESDPLNQNASIRYHLSINKPLRGYVCKPSRFERPVSLIGTLIRNRFNALYLRVFSDGATAFPGKQFPKMAGLDPDYLRQMIALAHERGIKVYAVLDVLRWSDGRKDSWVSKYPDLLDYDVLGRTRPEFARTVMERFVGMPEGIDDEETLSLIEFGEGLTCDAVSPFQPEVGKKLQGLLEELAVYDLDGLVLDYTTMRHTMLEWPVGEFYAAGRPGHNTLARLEFFRLHGVDSIDIPPSDSSLEKLPLQPIVKACSELQTPWAEFYRKSCDDLLESLAKKWQELHPTNPSRLSDGIPPTAGQSEIWVLATFRAGRESHDWPRFNGLVDGVLISGVDFPGTGGRYYGLKSMPILRASDRIGTLRFAALLAKGLGYDVSGFPEEFVRDSPWKASGIVLDFTTAGRKKNDYLRIIEPPKPGKNTGEQSP